VKPGGRLIYATCSLLREEDEDQAEWFLKTQAEFRTVPVGEIWSRTVGGECPSEGPYLVLTPKRNQTDGFFVAVFECVGVG
jgi:16S rRNA (cytosine967-C5)-methyltransferase